MDLPILSASAIGLAVLALAPDREPKQPGASDALLGQRLYASEDPVPRWGEPVLPQDLALEDLGQVAHVVTGPEGDPEAIVVAVGGLWGWGAQEVELGMERVHLLRDEGGGQRLVVDLSWSGAAPVEG